MVTCKSRGCPNQHECRMTPFSKSRKNGHDVKGVERMDTYRGRWIIADKTNENVKNLEAVENYQG